MAEIAFETGQPGHFRLKGCLQFDTVNHALQEGLELFADQPRIELDLQAVEATDSAGLALLVEWAGWAHREKRTLRLRHVPPQVLALARISEVDKLLPIG